LRASSFHQRLDEGFLALVRERDVQFIRDGIRQTFHSSRVR